MTTRERLVFEAEDIRDWRGFGVVDAAGTRIGPLDAVYFDTATERPSFATVRVSGVLGRRRLVFVPLADAKVGPDHLRVTAGKKLVTRAPSITSGGELTADAEASLFEHYGLRYEPRTSGERRLRR